MLRESFDEVAELYDRARPGYPAPLFADLAALAGIGTGTRVVEIGAGTAQATTGLVDLGATVVCVEPGAALAGLLRRKLANRRATVLDSTFEDLAAPDGSADAVAAFTAWHWLTPGVRTERAASVLRPGGALATVTTSHVTGSPGRSIFDDLQRCYERWTPESTEPGRRLPGAMQIADAVDEVDESPYFAPATRRRHERDITYATPEYLDVLRTYSDVIALPARRRDGLLGDIADVIDADGGTVTKRYLYELRVAVRR